MSVKFGLLGLLARNDQHGYELRRSFEQLTGGSWQLNHGQIYQTLEALAAAGLVSFAVQHEGSSPERKVYAITPRGQAALADWLAKPDVRLRPLRDELFVRLGIMATRPYSEAIALLASYRSLYAKHMRQLTAERNALTQLQPEVPELVMQRLLLEAVILHCEADIRWLDLCEDELAQRRRAGAS